MNAQQGLQSELHRKRKAGRKAFSGRSVSAPQQPSPLGTTTSTPSRVKSEMVESLMPGSSTGCAQPVSSATRWNRMRRC